MTVLQDFLNSPVQNVAMMRGKVRAGDLFGVEMELEGVNVGFNDMNPAGILDYWAPHPDGSLRQYKGHPPCEWVFNSPVKYKPAIERVNQLFDYLEGNKAEIVCSNRTSVHVHFNMADKAAYQVINMFILFSILEDLMDRYCGEDRNGNLFCLSSRHAQQQIQWVEDICFKNRQFMFKENQRYCSFNLASINKFGSVEFRGMRGLNKREDVIKWLDILNDFCNFACYEMKNPSTLLEDISRQGPMGLLNNIFSKKNVTELTKGLEEHEINASIYEGLRMVQMLCYRIGTEFDQVRLRGRDFWASFSEDKDLGPDVAAEDVRAMQAAPPRPRGARLQPINPFNEVPLRAAGGVNWVEAPRGEPGINQIRMNDAALRELARREAQRHRAEIDAWAARAADARQAEDILNDLPDFNEE